MIKITYGQLKNPEFLKLLDRIYKSKMAFSPAKKILSILRALEAELISADEAAVTLRAEHMEPSEMPGTSRPKKGEAHEQAVKDYLLTPVEIELPQITPHELSNVEISPSDVELLEGLLCDE